MIFEQFRETMESAHEKGIHLTGVIVFKESNFISGSCPIERRSFRVSSDSAYFDVEDLESNLRLTLYGRNLEGNISMFLDWNLEFHPETMKRNWEVEYCYMDTVHTMG